MSDPYRDVPGADAPDAPRDRGIVGDVIAQFADPYAFYRELVQNAIDAGSPDVAVELTYDAGTQRMRVAVRDKGEGMTREIVENQLLVLFRSTKETDRTKIGKFGIGFSSVLAPDPEVVAITTSRGGDKRLICHLYRDLTYELFDGGRASHAGTTVELELAMPHERVDPFCKASEAALVRWCRHASVPIELSIRVDGAHTTTRIDRPLGIVDALLSVEQVQDNGELTVVVAVTKAAKAYLGYFNHGLMLAERDEHGFGKVSIKVQDSRLGHTLSRDNVRNDHHLAHATHVIDIVVNQRLPVRAEQRLRELADAGNPGEHHDLVAALLASEVNPPLWHFPLLERRGDARSISTQDLGQVAWAAEKESALTKALAASGETVLRVRDGHRDTISAALRATGTRLREVDYELTLATAVELSDDDTALLELVRGLLAEVHREPAGVLLVELEGARASMLSVGLRDADTRVFDFRDAEKNPFAFFGRRTLALAANHPQVKAARKSEDPVLAAAHLARAILLQHRLLDEDRSRKLLDHALSGLGVKA